MLLILIAVGLTENQQPNCNRVEVEIDSLKRSRYHCLARYIERMFKINLVESMSLHG